MEPGSTGRTTITFGHPEEYSGCCSGCNINMLWFCTWWAQESMNVSSTTIIVKERRSDTLKLLEELLEKPGREEMIGNSNC